MLFLPACALAQYRFPASENLPLTYYQRNQIVNDAMDVYEDGAVPVNNQQRPFVYDDFSSEDYDDIPAVNNSERKNKNYVAQINSDPQDTNIARSQMIELTLEYLFAIKGEQVFEVINSGGDMISRLSYPLRGNMPVYKWDIYLLPKFYIGGKFANSELKRTKGTDTDWLPTVLPGIWDESYSKIKTKIQFYDLNFYFRILDLGAKEFNENMGVRDIYEDLAIKKQDKLLLDIFFGYQHYRARFGMSELVDTIEWWTQVNVPIAGEDSYYMVKYKGFRMGFLAKYITGKFSSSFSLARAWLKTKAYGWWNLRDYTFEQNGNKGYSLDMTTEFSYKITPHLSLGLGYNYMAFRQKKLLESGNQPGSVYDDLDIIRNVDSTLYGPFTKLSLTW